MKRIKNSVLRCMVLILTVFLSAPWSAVPVKADSMHFSKKLTYTVNSPGFERVFDMPANGRIVKVSVANEKIVTAGIYGMNSLFVEPKAVGKTTLKLTVEYGSKRKIFKSSVQVFKYTNPVASFKINGKEIKKVFNSKEVYQIKGTNKNTNVIVKPRAGWKITYVMQENYNTGKRKVYKTGPSKFSAKVRATKYSMLNINITNKKTGLIIDITIDFE